MDGLDEEWDMDDDDINDLMREYDETLLPLPSLDYEPHLLISKVRKHYFEFVIKLLKENYLKNNKKYFQNKFHLPSAIWRCAKEIETRAAQSCMVLQLYRKNIIPTIKKLKRDTSNGIIYNKLNECLVTPPKNEVKIQTSLKNQSTDQCECSGYKRRRKISLSPKSYKSQVNCELPTNCEQPLSKLPDTSNAQAPLEKVTPEHIENTINNSVNAISEKSDSVMIQLEKIFHSDSDGNNDVFENTLFDSVVSVDILNPIENKSNEQTDIINMEQHRVDLENHASKVQLLEDKFQSFEQLILSNGCLKDDIEKQKLVKQQRRDNSKWLCEEYFLRQKLSELLADIGDYNIRKLKRIKAKFTHLFGEESDEELMSPLDETPEFVNSCKERIAPWVVDLLTQHYLEGRIRDKQLFKKVEKYLVTLIYKCSQYPCEDDVRSFVTDFLSTHRMIKSEADYRRFRLNTL